MKDWQITGKNPRTPIRYATDEEWRNSLKSGVIGNISGVKIMVRKSIPITIWEEVPRLTINTWASKARQFKYMKIFLDIRWSNGIPYLVTKQGDK